MATEHHGKPLPEPRPGPAYERRDANANWLFGLVAILFLVIAGSEAILHWMNADFARKPQPTDRWTGTRQPAGRIWEQANFPRLQVSAPQDLARFREQEEAELTTYGWIDRTSGVVRIPIARAMDLVLQQGLPVRSGVGKSRLGPTPLELQQQRTNATQAETTIAR